MKKKIFSQEYKITSYLVNLRQRAGLFAILNLIQDVGWQHAESLGFDLAGEGLAWVFTRQKLIMKRWPALNETLLLRTWLRPVSKSFFIYRDYELYIAGEKIGECTSTFTVIDTQTRKLSQPDWSKFEGIWLEQGLLTHEPQKIPVMDGSEDLAQFQVRNSDLDLNDHVNNTKYAQWILDAVPLQLLKTVNLLEYEINFLAEVKKGDFITIQKLKETSVNQLVQFQGYREADKKIVYVARLLLKELLREHEA